MKNKIWITFRAEKIPGEAAAILTPTRCGPDVAEVSDYTIYADNRDITVDLKLDVDDERVQKVFALLQQYGVESDASPYIEYSEEDRQNAPLLLMLIRDINDSFHVSLSDGTKYDLRDACPNCRTGAQQTSVLYVDGDDLNRIRKHRAMGSGEAHILVDGGMVKKLKDAGVTGISFGEVRARKRNDKWTSVARDQILIEHTMPPIRTEPTAEDEQYLCKVCRRGGRQNFPQTPYREEDLVGMQDFNLTWEWFGEFFPEDKARDRGEKRPAPEILVTPKVMNIFRDAGVTTFRWTPVGIAE